VFGVDGHMIPAVAAASVGRAVLTLLLLLGQ
jgi:hypothetical protein